MTVASALCMAAGFVLWIVAGILRNRNPIVCSRCGVELRGPHSSGRKQVWHRTDAQGHKTYFCAGCKNK
jgi:hypothetical protein